ncbi:hypothetical protein E3Q18_04166 [Wallemia mellicola]|nr:hypothetical protein E3Q23_03953 [Wallemia mellicola]TIB85953.1 hypothetical protein E3Q19_04079 [Wallemia mellicola]TIB94873.1 hypothetical protein E3Q18_04166 [Wallemia mellicola]
MADLSEINNNFLELLSFIPENLYSHKEINLDEKYFKKSSNASKLQLKLNKQKSLREKLDPVVNGDAESDNLDTNASNIDDDGQSLQDLADSDSSSIQPMPSAGEHNKLKDKLHTRLLHMQRKRHGINPLDNTKDALLQSRRHQSINQPKKKVQLDKKPLYLDNKGKSAQSTSTEDKQQDSSLQFSHLQKINEIKQQKKQPSDPKQALQQLQAKKLKNKEKQSADNDNEDDNSDLWKSASAKASGIKVNDDEARLKKQIKRKDKVKAKSSKDWSERKKNLEKSMATAQKKKADNVANRKSKNKSAGPSKSKKRAGFEGKISNSKKPTKK